MANAYRDSVRKSAGQTDTVLRDRFVDHNKAYSLLEPVAESAKSNLNKANQRKWLDLTDVATAGAAGYATQDPTSTAGLVLARRALAPRLPSMMARATDTIGKGIQNIPKASGALMRGATNYGLKHAPEYVDKQAIANQGKKIWSGGDPDSILAKTQGTPYERALSEARGRGEQSFAATYYLMSQSDPEFRSMMEEPDAR